MVGSSSLDWSSGVDMGVKWDGDALEVFYFFSCIRNVPNLLNKVQNFRL
jgi:hypothetical protein